VGGISVVQLQRPLHSSGSIIDEQHGSAGNDGHGINQRGRGEVFIRKSDMGSKSISEAENSDRSI